MTAIVLAFDRRIPGDDAPVRLLGDAFVRNLPVLNEIAKARGVMAPRYMFSLSDKAFMERAQAFAQADAEGRPTGPPPSIHWLDPSDGLEVFRALADHIAAGPAASSTLVDDPDGVLLELRRIIAYLELADGHDVAFHLERQGSA